MRIAQLEGQRGSLKWMQRLAGPHAAQLDATLQAMGLIAPSARLRWLSPRADDHWAEYRDDAVLERIGRMDLADALAAFWPKRGPQWDGLATDGAGKLFLFETKAHMDELGSNCQAGSPAREHIERSIGAAKRAIGALESADWMDGYHQYAARLAHLQFFRRHQVNACLVFIYFTHDPDAQGPSTMEAWKAQSRVVARHLGLAGKPVDAVVNVFMDSRTLGD